MRAWLRILGLAGELLGPAQPLRRRPSVWGFTLKRELQGEGALMMLGIFEGDIVLGGATVKGEVWVEPPARPEERRS